MKNTNLNQSACAEQLRKEYHSPDIQKVYIDNEISMIMDSTPPVGPDESSVFPEHNVDNHFGNYSA